MLQVANKEMQSLLLTDFTSCFSVSVIDFESLFARLGISRIRKTAFYTFPSKQIHAQSQQ